MMQFTEKPSFTFYDGTTVNLLPIPPLLINMINNSNKGKPIPPKIEVVYAGKSSVLEPNYNDPNYIVELEQWEMSKQIRLLKLIYTRGVEGDFYLLASVDEINSLEELAEEIFSVPTEDDKKYLYIASKLVSTEEIERFQNAVLQLTVPTQDAIQDSFREV